MDPGITAALAVGLASYAGYAVHLSPLGLKIVAVGSISLLAAISVAGVRLGAGLMQWLTAFKLGALALITALALALRLGHWSHFVPFVAQRAGEAFAAQAGVVLFGHAGGRVLAGIVIVAVLGSLLALLMALPRVYYAMARDGVFLKAVAAVHPRFGTPARAIVLQAVLASLLV